MFEVLPLALIFLLRTQAASTDRERDDPQTVVTENRTFALPIQFNQRAVLLKEITKVRLFVSTNKGQTWRLTDVVAPTEKRFHFRAPAEGVYWFSVQVESEGGALDPEDVSKEPPALKVRVTNARELAARRAEPRRLLDPATAKLAEGTWRWLTAAPSSADEENVQALRNEMRRLRAEMERLEQRLADLEAGKKR